MGSLPMRKFSRDEQRQPPENLEQLAGVLLSFNDTTVRLQDTYDSLKSYISDLSAELEANLQEKDRIKGHLKNILESVSCGIIVTDMEDVVSTVNLAAGAIWDCEPSELVGLTLSDNLARLESWDGPNLTRLADRDIASPVEVSFHNPGSQRRYFLIFLCPLHDKLEGRTGTVTILEEVTRLKRLEKQIQRANQLSAMGEMVAALAHEIRNPLGSIELHASLIEKQLGTVSGEFEWREGLEHILRGVRSLNLTVSNMLLINQNPPSVFDAVDLAEHLQEVLGFIRPVLEDQSVVTEFEVEEGLPPALGDRELLSQVWLNLLYNALQAMVPEGGRISVAVRRSTALDISTHSENGCSNGAVEIEIADTGHGIKPAVVERIFNPFFTTRPKGTGLGLAIVHKIVEVHRGTVDVESELGRGTAFTITLPAHTGCCNDSSDKEEASYGRRRDGEREVPFHLGR
jgi:signal transduction histidine kinase